MGNGSFVTAVKWGESQNEVQMEILQAFYIGSQNRAKEIDQKSSIKMHANKLKSNKNM